MLDNIAADIGVTTTDQTDEQSKKLITSEPDIDLDDGLEDAEQRRIRYD